MNDPRGLKRATRRLLHELRKAEAGLREGLQRIDALGDDDGGPSWTDLLEKLNRTAELAEGASHWYRRQIRQGGGRVPALEEMWATSDEDRRQFREALEERGNWPGISTGDDGEASPPMMWQG